MLLRPNRQHEWIAWQDRLRAAQPRPTQVQRQRKFLGLGQASTGSHLQRRSGFLLPLRGQLRQLRAGDKRQQWRVEARIHLVEDPL